MDDPSPIALIVANGILPSPDLLAALAAGSSLLIGVDGGADQVIASGFIPDIVTGDFDSVSDALPLSVRRVPAPDQNYTDLDKAVAFARDEGYSTIWITGAIGDRMDHTFSALSVLAKHGADANITLFDNVGAASLVVHSAEFDTEVGQTISLLPLGQVTEITTSGLKWNLTFENLEPGIRDGISNVAVEERVSISVGSGSLIVYIHHSTSR